MAKPKAKSAAKRDPAEPRSAKTPAPRVVTAAAPKRKTVSPVRLKRRGDRLERLWDAIQQVSEGRRDSPRTARLLAAGAPKMAQKVVEEAAEVAIEAVRGDRAALVNESVDLLYNLTALLNGMGLDMKTIWAEMDRREATLGMAEKLPKTNEV